MRSIQSAVLIPLGAFILLLVGGASLGFLWHDQAEEVHAMENTIAGVEETFQRIVRADADLMQAAISAIQRIDGVREAFGSRDRTRLLALTEALFQELKARHRITHFYFHLPDRVNFLRVHQPQRHGDLIRRHTARLALETDRPASGLELGPLGTFTLRTVVPWRLGDDLIGFIELGEEIDHVVNTVQRLFHLDLFVFVPKDFLERSGWEAGMAMLARPARWDAYSDVVLIDQSLDVPPPLLRRFVEDAAIGQGRLLRHDLAQGEQRMNLARLPILDANGQEKAFMVMLQEITQRRASAERLVLLVIGGGGAGGAGLMLLFWFLLNRIERRLRTAEDRESRLGRIIDASIDGVWVFDAKTFRFMEANQEALARIGRTLDQLRALTPADLLVDVDRPRLQTLVRPLREEQTRQAIFESALVGGDAKPFPVDVRLQLFPHEQPPVFVAIVRDITRRKQREQALQESEERFRSISASARDAIIMIDDRERIIFWNQAATRIFGYAPEQAQGERLHQLLAPERFREAAEQGMEIFRKTGEGNVINRTVELWGARKNGEEFPFELSTSALTHEGKWRAIGILRDITQRKEVEQKLKLGSKVIESALEGIIITDTRGVIQMVNPAFCRLTEYDVSDVTGKNPSLLQSGRHDQSFYQEMWGALLETDAWQGEVWNRRKSGGIIAEWLSISAIRNDRREVTHYVGVFSDITERKKLEQHMETLAFYDPLTAVPNRMLFNERLLQAIREAQRGGLKLAVFFLDLDFFKQVNDTHGHDVGDLLLQQTAQRLKAQLRSEDTVARFGGDEFAVLLKTVQHPDDAILVAVKIIQELTRPFDLNGIEGRIGASIGISLYPSQADDAERLLKYADEAMYMAKKAGRNRYRIYGEEGE